MGPKATQVMDVAKKGNFWLGLLSGGIGSFAALAIFFIGIGQKLEARDQAISNVTATASSNTNEIKTVKGDQKQTKQEISDIKKDVAVIKNTQATQKERLNDIKEAQKEQTKLIQQILLELKK